MSDRPVMMWWRDARAISLFGLIAGCLFMSTSVMGRDGMSKPRRIVSLNLCSDQNLFGLVSRDRIAALFILSGDRQYSNIARDVAGIPLIRGGAEEVMRLGADLVLAGPYTTKATVTLLKRLGHRVVIVPVATSFAMIADNIELIAKAVGEDARGRLDADKFRERLRTLKARVGSARPLAAVIYTNNFTASPGSLAAEVVAHAGYRNLGTREGASLLSRLGLEEIIFNRPDILIKGHASGDYHTVLGDNLRHPVLAGVFSAARQVEIPERLWLCGTARTLDALERLIDARSNVGGD